MLGKPGCTRCSCSEGFGGRQWPLGCGQQWVTPCSRCSLQPSHGSAAQDPVATGELAGRQMASTTAPAPTASPGSTARSVRPPDPRLGHEAVVPLTAQLPPALCPQVSRTPVPQGPARTGEPASTTLASTSATVPQATLAGTARLVGVSRVCQCQGMLGEAVAAISKPRCLL